MLGFTSDTLQLQKSGWLLSMHQEVTDSKIQLAIHHPACALYAVSNRVSLDFASSRYLQFAADIAALRHLQFDMVQISDKLTFACSRLPYNWPDMGNLSSFEPVSGIPELTTATYARMSDLKIFAPILDPSKSLIVDPNDVQEIMNHILKVQKPVQDDIRKRAQTRINLEGMAFDAGPAKKIHAQLISLEV
jgi:hypothetical protein